jgi:hypothetical protein
VTKRSEISDNSGLDITKHMDDSAQSFLDSDANPYKKVILPHSHSLACDKEHQFVSEEKFTE